MTQSSPNVYPWILFGILKHRHYSAVFSEPNLFNMSAFCHRFTTKSFIWHHAWLYGYVKMWIESNWPRTKKCRRHHADHNLNRTKRAGYNVHPWLLDQEELPTPVAKKKPEPEAAAIPREEKAAEEGEGTEVPYVLGVEMKMPIFIFVKSGNLLCEISFCNAFYCSNNFDRLSRMPKIPKTINNS